MRNKNQILDARQYFEELLRTIPAVCYEPIDGIADALIEAYEAGRSVYVFGNGGSAALASHFACDLGKGTAHCDGGKRFRIMALTDNLALITAWANDSSYDHVFSEQLCNFICPDDLAFAISGSGNSTNVLNALEAARNAGAMTLGLSGFNGGRMKDLCDICAVVPSNDMQIIEDIHLAMAHSIFRIVSARITRGTATPVCPGIKTAI